MPQTKKRSLYEALTNSVGGFALALYTQVMVFPYFGIYVSLTSNATITVIFMAISMARGYAVRRFFDWLDHR